MRRAELCGARLLTIPLTHGVLLGGLFGLAFGLFFAKRATSAGAGLIWGVASALLLWMLVPAGILPMLKGYERSMGMLSDARAQFPELVAYLLCLGMPVGVAWAFGADFAQERGSHRSVWVAPSLPVGLLAPLEA